MTYGNANTLKELWVSNDPNKITFLAGGFLHPDGFGIVLDNVFDNTIIPFTVDLDSYEEVEPTIQLLLKEIPSECLVAWGE